MSIQKQIEAAQAAAARHRADYRKAARGEAVALRAAHAPAARPEDHDELPPLYICGTCGADHNCHLAGDLRLDPSVSDLAAVCAGCWAALGAPAPWADLAPLPVADPSRAALEDFGARMADYLRLVLPPSRQGWAMDGELALLNIRAAAREALEGGMPGAAACELIVLWLAALIHIEGGAWPDLLAGSAGALERFEDAAPVAAQRFAADAGEVRQ